MSGTISKNPNFSLSSERQILQSVIYGIITSLNNFHFAQGTGVKYSLSWEKGTKQILNEETNTILSSYYRLELNINDNGENILIYGNNYPIRSTNVLDIYKEELTAYKDFLSNAIAGFISLQHATFLNISATKQKEQEELDATKLEIENSLNESKKITIEDE